MSLLIVLLKTNVILVRIVITIIVNFNTLTKLIGNINFVTNVNQEIIVTLEKIVTT